MDVSVNTEMTEYGRGWVFYDAECPFCRRWADRGHDVLSRRGLHLAPLQSEWVRIRLGLNEAEPPTEMKLLLTDGRLFGGADALIQIARFIWWAWPFYLLAQLPGVRPMLRVVYRYIAGNRYCLRTDACNPTRNRSNNHHRSSSFYELP
jgi:predicted DCC family thiol-disulfide oxidoreductase YuxK